MCGIAPVLLIITANNQNTQIQISSHFHPRMSWQCKHRWFMSSSQIICFLIIFFAALFKRPVLIKVAWGERVGEPVFLETNYKVKASGLVMCVLIGGTGPLHDKHQRFPKQPCPTSKPSHWKTYPGKTLMNITKRLETKRWEVKRVLKSDQPTIWGQWTMDVGRGEIYLYFKNMSFDLSLYLDVKANN